MDGLTALTKIIEALAWPSVVVMMICFFRIKINAILDRVKIFKGWGAEFELENMIQVAQADVIVKSQKVIEAAESSPEAREKAASEFLHAQREVEKLLNRRIYLASKLSGLGLTKGRESILREFIKAIGPARIAELSSDKLMLHWPTFLDELSDSPYTVNGGAMVGLSSVGLVDHMDQLTILGAEICVTLAKEMVLSDKLATPPQG